MKYKPKFFNIEVKIGDYIFYESNSTQHNRVYVPRTKESFEEFIDKLWELTENPTEKELLNKVLVKRYPFIFPKNRWDGGIYLQNIFNKPSYDRWFSRTEVDWLLEMDNEKLIELLENLIREFDKHSEDFKYQYMITDIKEKYNTLRWYDAGNTEEGYRLLDEYCDYITNNYFEES